MVPSIPANVQRFLREFSEKNEYNRICAECREQFTTHALIFLGILVC